MRPLSTPTQTTQEAALTPDEEYGAVLNPYHRVGLNPIDENAIVDDAPDSTFGKAFDRGTDQLHASLYGFTKAIGETLGVDALSKWSDEGIESNLNEMLRNPPEVRDWDDVNSLAEFGTYFLEALGEQAPQFMVDIPLVAASLATTGPGGAAASVTARAQLGKAVKRQLGERAFINFKRGVKAAPVASLIAQGVGESQLEMDAADGDSQLGVWSAGLGKAFLDKLGLETIVGRAAKIGVSPQTLTSTAVDLTKAALVGTGIEAGTEGLQTIIDKTAVGLATGQDIFSEENLKELREAMIKGGLVGGTMSSGLQAASAYATYAHGKKSAADKAFENTINTAVEQELNQPYMDASNMEAPTNMGGGRTEEEEKDDTDFDLPTEELNWGGQKEEPAVSLLRDLEATVRGFNETVNQYAEQHSLRADDFNTALSSVFNGLSPGLQKSAATLLEAGTPEQQAMIQAQLFEAARAELNQPKKRKLSDTADVRHLEETGSPAQRMADQESLQGDYIEAVTNVNPLAEADAIDDIHLDPTQVADDPLAGLTKDSKDAIAPAPIIPASTAERSRHTEYREELYTNERGEILTFLKEQDASNSVYQLNEGHKDKPFTYKPEWVRAPGEKKASKRFRVYETKKPEKSEDQDPETYFQNVITAAKRNGEARYGASQSTRMTDETKKKWRDAQVTVADPDTGEVLQLATMDLATGGMNLLKAETVQGMEADQYRLSGFLHSLTRLMELGYVLQSDIPTGDNANTVSPFKVDKKGRFKVNPDLILDHGNLSKSDIKLRVKDVLFTPEQTRQIRAGIIKAKSEGDKQKVRELERQLATDVRLHASLDKLDQLENEAKAASMIGDTETASKKRDAKKRIQTARQSSPLFNTDDSDPTQINTTGTRIQKKTRTKSDISEKDEQYTEIDYLENPDTGAEDPMAQPREVEGGDIDNAGVYVDDQRAGTNPAKNNFVRLEGVKGSTDADRLAQVNQLIGDITDNKRDTVSAAEVALQKAIEHNRVSPEQVDLAPLQKAVTTENAQLIRLLKERAELRLAIDKQQHTDGKPNPQPDVKAFQPMAQGKVDQLRTKIAALKSLPQTPETKKALRDAETELGLEAPRFGQTTLKLVDSIMREVGLNLNITMVDPRDLVTYAEAGHISIQEAVELQQEFTRGRGMKNGPKAAFISNGKEGVIVIPALRQNASQEAQAQQLWRIAHELGHGILNASMDTMNQAQWDAAHRMFLEDQKNSSAYQGQYGFAEWYADQVANRAFDKAKKWKKKGQRNGVLNALFDKVLAKMNSLLRAFNRELSKRFKSHKDFDQFMEDMKAEGVFKKATSFGFGPREYYTPEQRQEMKDQVKQWVKNIYEKPFVKHPVNVVIPTDLELRFAFGDLGKQIADMFYWPFNTEKPTKRPWLSVHKEATERYLGDFFDTLGVLNGDSTRFTDAELKEAFDQLAQERPDAELNDAAKLLRTYLKNFHTEFLKNSIPTVGEVKNYFPRQYVQQAIETRRTEFDSILRQHGYDDPDALFQQLFESEVGLEAFTASMAPSGKHTKERSINDPELIADLAEAGFINNNPVETIVAYLFSAIQEGTYHYEFGGYRYLPGASKNSTIARMRSRGRPEDAEIAERIRDERIEEFLALNGLQSLEQAIEYNYARMDGDDIQVYDKSMKINQRLEQGLTGEEITPQQAARIRKLIAGMQGKLALDMNPTWKQTQSNAMMITNWLTLFLAPISSLIEAATLFKSVKDVDNYRFAVKGIVASLRDRKQLLDLYGQMGMVEHTLHAHILSAMYGYQNATSFAQKGNELLFKLNGQSWLTTTMRVAAAETGKQFIKHHATQAQEGDARSLRYLKELGIDNPSVVTEWVEQGEPLWDMESNNRVARVVQSGISRFIESSVLTPSRAERPGIMNDPRAGLFWHLKSFAYAFSNVVVRGSVNEWQARNKENEGAPIDTKLADNAKYLLPMVGVFMGLAAIVNELREEIQYRLGGRYRPSDMMDTGEYISHLLFNRIGFGAVPDMYTNAIMNEYNNTLGIFALSPTLGKADQILTSRDSLNMVMNSTPVLAQNPGAKRALRKLWKELDEE